jgi:hypothetical protein
MSLFEYDYDRDNDNDGALGDTNDLETTNAQALLSASGGLAEAAGYHYFSLTPSH